MENDEGVRRVSQSCFKANSRYLHTGEGFAGGLISVWYQYLFVQALE